MLIGGNVTKHHRYCNWIHGNFMSSIGNIRCTSRLPRIDTNCQVGRLRSSELVARWIEDPIRKANDQGKRSGSDEQGNVELQLRGEDASRASFDATEPPVMRLDPSPAAPPARRPPGSSRNDGGGPWPRDARAVR